MRKACLVALVAAFLVPAVFHLNDQRGKRSFTRSYEGKHKSYEGLAGLVTLLNDQASRKPLHRTPIYVAGEFTDDAGDQVQVEVHLLEGLSESAADNRSVCRFHLTGIPKMKAAVPQVELTVEVDTSGRLTASAIEKSSGSRIVVDD